LEMVVDVPSKGTSGMRLKNAAGECVDLYFDTVSQRFVMDRTQAGIDDFGESRDQNTFAMATWAPLDVKGKHTVKIIYDICSLEVFIDGGKVAMTNLVFPDEPYNVLEFYSDKGRMVVTDLKITTLGL